MRETVYVNVTHPIPTTQFPWEDLYVFGLALIGIVWGLALAQSILIKIYSIKNRKLL